MIVPSAQMIEQARDRLCDADRKTKHAHLYASQDKELHVALGDRSEDYIAGYQLGLETARVLVEGLPEAVVNEVTI